MAYQDEDSLNAELRDLTEKTRKLREEMRGQSRDVTRGLARVPTSPKARRVVSGADERQRKPRSGKKP